MNSSVHMQISAVVKLDHKWNSISYIAKNLGHGLFTPLSLLFQKYQIWFRLLNFQKQKENLTAPFMVFNSKYITLYKCSKRIYKVWNAKFQIRVYVIANEV